MFLGSNVTPVFLVEQCENKTSHDADAAVSKYIGKWLRVSAVLKDLTSVSENRFWASLVVPRKITYVGVEMDFHVDIRAEFTEDLERLKVLQKDDFVVVEGCLERVNTAYVDMKLCKLIKSAAPDELRAATPAPQSLPSTEEETPQ